MGGSEEEVKRGGVQREDGDAREGLPRHPTWGNMASLGNCREIRMSGGEEECEAGGRQSHEEIAN